jgi:hypothetical protein
LKTPASSDRYGVDTDRTSCRGLVTCMAGFIILYLDTSHKSQGMIGRSCLALKEHSVYAPRLRTASTSRPVLYMYLNLTPNSTSKIATCNVRVTNVNGPGLFARSSFGKRWHHAGPSSLNDIRQPIRGSQLANTYFHKKYRFTQFNGRHTLCACLSWEI